MSHISQLALDDSNLPPPTPEIDQERKVAMFDLLEENTFALPNRDDRVVPDGPYHVDLSIREKRLMVLGATAMLGRQDLIEIQMTGALVNGEFTDEQLEQIPLFLLFYAGAGNTTAVFRGIEAAKARVADMKKGG